MTNLILNTDSYKFSHYLQYPPLSTRVSSYIEPRGVAGDFPATNEVVNFGLQAFISEYLTKPITTADIEEAKEIAALHGVPFNEEGWKIIVDEYNGYLPLEIEALPEGTVFPIRNCQVQVVNTDPRLQWLTSYIETALIRALWYPSTVATLSREVKKVFKTYLDKTSDNPDAINFMLHDFGARGVSSKESAGLGGLAHLVNFMGTDTVEALVYARKYYGEKIAGYSIPAAEHSTITAWRTVGGELSAFSNMIDQFGGKDKIYAVVSDSYDIYNAVERIWGEQLKYKVLTKGGRLVVRPDSGKPVLVVMACIKLLGDKFGYSFNSKGFKVLNNAVRVIQGDGVDYHSIGEILEALTKDGWSVENLAFGMGGALLQKVNRDSLKYAMKANAIEIDGVWHEVFKDPVTDHGKVSKKGRLAVIDNGGKIETIQLSELNGRKNLLETVYKNGRQEIVTSLPVIRKMAAI